MATVYVGVGSNIEPRRNLPAAVAALRARYGPLTLSPVYESEAVGFAGDNFLNMVVAFTTDEEPGALNRALHDIEERYGRRRGGPRFSSRSVDLDLLLYDDLVLEGEGLALPRDEITRYAFVLRPLADIAPDARYPLTGERYADLWAAFDASGQPLWPVTLDLA